MVLTDLSRWPTTGLERIKTSSTPTWCCWQVPQAPRFTSLPGTKQQWGKNLWFCWFLGWAGCLCGWLRPPRDWGMLGSPAVPWLAGRWDQAPTIAALSSACGVYSKALTASSTITRKEKEENTTGATVCSKYQCYHLTLNSPPQCLGPLIECCVLLDITAWWDVEERQV